MYPNVGIEAPNLGGRMTGWGRKAQFAANESSHWPDIVAEWPTR